MDVTKCVTFVGALLLLGAFLPADACSCMPIDHPQRSYCDSNTVIQLKFIKESKKGTENGYIIEISQILKGDAALQNSKYIATSESSASCKYEHLKEDWGTDYVALVHNESGRISVGSCNFVRRWSKLTTAQIAGFKGAYKPGCGTCKIVLDGMTPCDSPPCEPAKNTCVLEDENKRMDQACLPEGDSCAWKTM